jgi:hypothetical protein
MRLAGFMRVFVHTNCETALRKRVGSPAFMRGNSALKPSGSRGLSPPALAAGFSSELLRSWIDFSLESRRGVRILLGMLRQPSRDRIHPEIFDVFCILVCVSDPVLVVTLLSYFTLEDHLLSRTVGESTFDELHCFLKRYERRRRKDKMNVISLENELVNLKASAPSDFHE